MLVEVRRLPVVVVGRVLPLLSKGWGGVRIGGRAGTEGVDVLRGYLGRAPLYLDILRAMVCFVSGSGALASDGWSTGITSGGLSGLADDLDPRRSLRDGRFFSASI